jgi:hypothetical protein
MKRQKKTLDIIQKHLNITFMSLKDKKKLKIPYYIFLQFLKFKIKFENTNICEGKLKYF